VPVGSADEWVTEAALDDGNPYAGRVFVPGDDRSDEIGKLRERGAEAMKRGDYDAATQCMKIAGELESLPSIAPHWEELYSCQSCGAVKAIAPCVAQGHHITTRGEHFASLGPAERREELSQRWVVQLDKDGAMVLPRDWP
jgi:hypothetical protein